MTTIPVLGYSQQMLDFGWYGCLFGVFGVGQLVQRYMIGDSHAGLELQSADAGLWVGHGFCLVFRSRKSCTTIYDR